MQFCSNVYANISVFLFLILLYSWSSFNTIFQYRRQTFHNFLSFRPSPRQVESCLQWHGALRNVGGSLHYVLIGAQKAGTSTLSKFIRFHHHTKKASGTAPKEFHLFDQLVRGSGNDTGYVTGISNSSVASLLRKEKLNDGFRNASYSTQDLQRYSGKILHGDATPRYLMSYEVARLIHLLHPHARILISLRDPTLRAISHLRMFAEYGKVDKNPYLGAYFDAVLTSEMDAAEFCGWDQTFGSFHNVRDITTFTDFAACVRIEADLRLESLTASSPLLSILHEKIQRDWFVIRGLYAEMLPSWMNYFPTSRIRIFDFSDIICDMPKVLKELEKFLCLPEFDEEAYTRARKAHACENARSKAEIKNNAASPSRKVINRVKKFYAVHNLRLFKFTNHYFHGDVELDWVHM